ncbi:MAG: GIY-YIG nuclease family protein [Halobacteriales archaeon]|nr:GIY-YIG nuclease family protein [Halobacteriales archaeon]
MTDEDRTEGKGTYTLLVRVEEPMTVEVGALGDVRFEDALYAYTGSAFGAGGLKRIDRHARVASGENDARHWHIDYLLGAEETKLVGAFVTPDDAEHKISQAIEGEAVPCFGASDSPCDSHLKTTTRDAVKEAYEGREHGFRRIG